MTSPLSQHDAAVKALEDIYVNAGRYIWTNPGQKRTKQWAGYYIDAIVVESPTASRAWVIEVETGNSVSAAGAGDQWRRYDEAYEAWFLAVPRESQSRATGLISEYGLRNVRLVTWIRDERGIHTFWGLPGL